VAARRKIERADPIRPVCLPIPFDLLPAYTGGDFWHDIIDAVDSKPVTFC